MPVNRNNPFQKQFIDSFQGKNADDVQQQYPPSVLRELRKNNYRVDGIGSNDPNDRNFNPRFNTLVPRSSTTTITDQGVVISGASPVRNNPAPQDNSIFESPPFDNIRIGRSEALTVPAISSGDVDVIQDESGNLKRIQLTPGRSNRSGRQDRALADRGSRGQGISPDAPEDDYYEEDFDANISSYGVTDDDSETGSPLGLNSDRKSKTKIGQSKDAVAINQGPFMEDLTKVQIDPRPNEMNGFSSISYNIALYMMNSKSYVDITSQPRTPAVALSPPNAFLLMRSGGVGLENSGTDFSNDFFIDDLEVTNIAVGPSKFKQNTNATDIRFVINEPRGVTLLERLQRLAGTVLASTKERYIHAPYMLEIKFKGYDENGTPLSPPSQPKYIPIRITDMQFEVTSSGTQYRVTAIPFANHAMGSIVSTIPFNVELQAQTVGDIFSSGVTIERTVEERVPEYGAEEDDFGNRDLIGERITKKTVKSKAKNLGEILTNQQRKRTSPSTALVQKNFEVVERQIPPAAEKYDSYKFMIAGEIANAKLNLNDLYDALNTPAPTEESKNKNDKSKGDKRQYEAYVKGLTTGITLDKDTQTFKVNAGTDISKLINLVILHSDYMDQNVVDNAQKYVTEGQPINWFKIRPIIESATGDGKGMDNKEGRYKYNITFAVEKSNIYYNDFPWAKKGKPVGQGFHKVYNYIYSGNNTEVLSFDLKFRTAFLQVMTAGTGSPFANKDDTFSPVVQELPQSLEGNTINSQDNIKRARAKDLFSSVMSDGVDMVELDMSIVGDPSYLPTSDAYWQDKVRAGASYTEPFMPDGTINYNLTPPFVQVNLKTPVDYDENSGLANPSRYGNSSFSGVYRLTQIDSTFSGGQFQQRINGIRAPLQPTATGLARTAKDQAGAERSILQQDIDPGDFELNTRVANRSGVATVIDDPFDELAGDYEETPIGPTVYNDRIQRIARNQQDRSVNTIQDSPVSESQAWATRYKSSGSNYPDGAL